ncbi:sulfite oxidase heme-binding subunit YedZ [Granulicella sibirica]|uniref:Protein-methionine-sulfoxide reductase heme-binding subunit MsrQ n=1 Tax=Granulicella sibirica TaxID=2479048 RepID=A0A4Q0SZF2_9BACT|nr:protein-methionine-sulfoxide reductase heme-binding subunit MsrQ [Granulicella sibirica]RXH54909.1 Membrane protein YedZ [Granulicella sibirica]
MPTRAIPYVKVLVHLICLFPLMGMIYAYRSGALANDADPVNTLTHWTGDWALWWLFVSLAVTPIRRLSPKLSNLIRFRRMLGLYAFVYATLHLSTYVFLFSGFDVQAALDGVRAGHLGVIGTQLKAVWPTMLDDVLKRKFIQVGLFAWVVLLALAVTSPTFMLRAMGGKNWQRLHRFVYAAAIAGCIHYWWMVKVGVRTPWKDSAVLAVLLGARVVWTVWNERRKAKMVAVKAA